MDKTNQAQKKTTGKNISKFSVGDTVRVDVKIVEAGKQRIQPFEGIVIARKGSGKDETFTVRRISYGEGVERIFLVRSPSVEKIEVVRTGKVRRGKLYYLRKKIGKKTRVEEKIISKEEQPSDASSGKEG